MPSLSIVVPFSGSTAHLITDLSTAVQGADEVIVVDNASSEDTAAALREVEKYPGGIYIRNETNIGFAAANNQGYARATGDVVMFLNSDVIGAPGWLGVVKHDVREGALYGPSLAQQLVYGMWLPYLEGWCIAATQEVWEKLRTFEVRVKRSEPEPFGTSQLDGPWDHLSYPGPYWEDNDLCLRAIQANVQLVHTRWGQDRLLAHKGGQTAGAIVKHGATFEQNRATFAGRVRSVWEAKIKAENLI